MHEEYKPVNAALSTQSCILYYAALLRRLVVLWREGGTMERTGEVAIKRPKPSQPTKRSGTGWDSCVAVTTITQARLDHQLPATTILLLYTHIVRTKA